VCVTPFHPLLYCRSSSSSSVRPIWLFRALTNALAHASLLRGPLDLRRFQLRRLSCYLVWLRAQSPYMGRPLFPLVQGMVNEAAAHSADARACWEQKGRAGAQNTAPHLLPPVPRGARFASGA